MLSKAILGKTSKLLEESRDRGVEGFMLKKGFMLHPEGSKALGIWKIDPYLADMVVVSAQLGHGNVPIFTQTMLRCGMRMESWLS